MRIDGWHVDGFGILKDFDQDGLRPGVTVLLGANEAGKSTLLAFLRAVLFGPADAATKADWSREPVHGGRHGGELRLRDGDGGLWVVERYADVKKKAAKLRRPDGSEGDADDLAVLLGAADAGLFRSVFAFGLDELRQFESLTGKGVGERIFDVGISGAGTSAREVMRRLGLRQDALLKLRGAARINDVVRELKLVESQEREARAFAGRYEQLRSDEGAQTEAAAGLQAESERLQRRKTETEVLIELRPQWDKLAELRHELAALPRVEDVLLPDQVAGLVRDLEGQRAREERLPDLQHAQATESAVVRGALERLGAGWDVARVRSFDRSVSVEDEVRAWEATLAEAKSTLHDAQQGRAAADAEAARLAAQRDRVRAELPEAEPLEVEVIDEREALVRGLRDDLNRCEMLRLTAEQAAPGPDGSRARLVFVLAALAAVGAVVGWIAGYAQLGVGLVVAAVLLAVAGALTASRGSQRAAGREGDRGVIDELRAVMGRTAQALGLPAQPSSADLAQCEASLRSERTRRGEWDGAQVRIRDAVQQADEARRLAGEASAAEHEAQVLRDDCAGAWAAWLAPRGLRALTPAGVGDVLRQVEAARAADVRRLAATAVIEAIARRAAEWEASARLVLEAAGRPSPALSTAALRTAVETLDDELERRALLVADAASRERAVSVRLGSCEDPVRARERLASGDVGVWQDRVVTLAHDLTRLRAERDAALEAATVARREWQAIEQSAAIPRLQEDRESRRAQLADLVHEYRVVCAAGALVAETLKTFARERQPAVLASGSEAFAAVTGGRYVAVQLDAEAGLGSVVVVNRDGVQLKPDALSTGTQQQLYLSIRLALVAEFGRRAVPLPLIMDDCLVNFDPRRAAAVAGLLAQRSADGQCLLFTCHPETAELMARQTAGPVQVIEMGA
jgi:hypothetical protein